MHRSLVAAIALTWLTTPGAVAQNFQFMPLVPRTPTSLVPQQWSFRGYAVGDDFDGNGHGDLLVTSSFGVAQCMGTATGFVAASPLVWAEQLPRLVDFEGDGDRDVAFVPPLITTPTAVLLYRSTPSGLAYVALPSPMNGVLVQGVALGDIDANGFADMVIAVRVGSVTPSLILARGSGPGIRFTLDMTSMPAGLPLGLWPEVLDADGDGDLDVLATNATSGLRLLQNVGGTFVDATATLPPARLGHTHLTVADFDGDGRDDCAALLLNDVDMLWGGASGLTFSQAFATIQGLIGLVPADFDGDGDLDILADHGGGLDVLWNQGNRQFTRGDIVRPRVAMRGTADINGDGRMDVLYALPTSDRVVRCKFSARSEDGASSAGMPPVSGTQMGPSAAGDVDGDGRTDLVTPQLTQLTVDHAVGGGLYQRANLPLANPGTGRQWRTQLADMDRDGDLDLVVRDDARLAIADNTGAGAFAWTLQRTSMLSAHDDLRLGDVDGDGDLDIAYADPQGVQLVRNNGGGQYALPIAIVSQLPGYCVELADVDGDNDLDVIAARTSAHVIFANNGAGIFAPNPAFSVAAGTGPTSLRAGDFDGDGDQDLAVADTGPRLHRNNGSGSFTETTASDLPALAGVIILSNLVAADLDDDGDLDLSAVKNGSPQLLLLINDGTGRFSDRSAARVQQFNGMGTFWRLGAADVDDDGDVDLIAAGGNQQTVLVNHLRHCRSNSSLRLGNVADFHLVSGPNIGSPGTGLLGVGFAVAAPPLEFPGLAGQLELDPATLQIVAAVATSPIGVSSAFVPVPQDPVLFGLEVWFQGGILPTVGRAGFTNAISEIIVR